MATLGGGNTAHRVADAHRRNMDDAGFGATGTGRWAALAVALAAASGYAAESTTPVSFSVGDDGRTRIEVPSAADVYHVLYYRSDPNDAATETAVAIHMGAAGRVVLTEPLKAIAGAYRVATHRRNAPADTDGDGADDLTELARSNLKTRAPLNPSSPNASRPNDGAVAIPDLATFQALSYKGISNAGEPVFADVEHLNFIFYDPSDGAAGIYFANQNVIRTHSKLIDWAGLGGSTGASVGQMAFYPYLVAPSGAVGTFAWGYDHFSDFEEVAGHHERLAANMPFLRNNLVFTPQYFGRNLTEQIERVYLREKAKYDASRIPVVLHKNLFANSVFQAVNPAVGYGLLRVLGPGERPTFREIPILRTLPNDLPAFAGVISLQPQTALSHVNLRAVQDGVPNAWIANALEDETISALIGEYVRFEVREGANPPEDWEADTGDDRLRATYTIREATADEVTEHHAARRPAAAQVPTRDLAETTYKDLDDIAFADSDAFGTKAANVAAMRDFGFAAGTVPDGYALPFYFYDEFMKHNDFYGEVDTLLADPDFDAAIATREDELKKLRRRIRNGAVPDWMNNKLGELQAEFPATTSIRCRSSTNNEDLPKFSGAGLYDSYTHHPTEGHLSKSIKQVFASLWNLRAFEEREFHRIDHKAAAMGVLLHPNYSDEKANGVAVSDDPFFGSDDRFYVNAQVGEDLVTNPSSASVPEELLLGTGEEFTTTLLRRSNLVGEDERVLSDTHIALLQAALRTIHSRFRTLYDVAEDEEEFAMEIEFKVTSAGTFAVKQARPWVY